jgi:hypothetical protein
LDPVDAEDGHGGDFVGDHVKNNARLTERGGVAARVLVRVTDGVGVVSQVFDSGVERGPRRVGQLAQLFIGVRDVANLEAYRKLSLKK